MAKVILQGLEDIYRFFDIEDFTDESFEGSVLECPEELLVDYIENSMITKRGFFWYNIAGSLNLSEDFIKCYIDEFQKDSIDFEVVLNNQKLSEEFLIANIDYIHYLIKTNDYDFEECEKIPEDVKNNVLNLLKVIDQ